MEIRTKALVVDGAIRSVSSTREILYQSFMAVKVDPVSSSICLRRLRKSSNAANKAALLSSTLLLKSLTLIGEPLGNVCESP